MRKGRRYGPLAQIALLVRTLAVLLVDLLRDVATKVLVILYRAIKERTRSTKPD